MSGSPRKARREEEAHPTPLMPGPGEKAGAATPAEHPDSAYGRGTGADRSSGLKGPDSIAGAAQDVFWRERFRDRGYTDPEQGYEHYRPAFRTGWEARAEHPIASFDEVEETLRERWNPELTGLTWHKALPAIRDAFERGDGTAGSRPDRPPA